MKAILLVLFPLLGAALLASAGEQAKPAATQKTTTALTGNVVVVTKAADEETGQKATRPVGITLQVLRSTGQTAASLLNPLAPLEQAPATPWLTRAAWSAVADRAMSRPSPIETWHEPQFSVVIWRCY